MRLILTILVGLVILSLLEAALVVPLIVTQRVSDFSVSQAALELRSDKFAEEVNRSLALFVYSVSRTSAAVSLDSGFFTQEELRLSLRLGLNPLFSDIQTFIWVPRVVQEERASYEQFYGFPITESNGSFIPSRQRDVYYPYTLFEPWSSSYMRLNGFDFLSNNRSASYLRNVSLHLEPHSAINKTSPNSFGIVVVSQEDSGKGYVLGLASMEDFLVSALDVDRDQVTLAAYDASAEPSLQLLYLDDSRLLRNATTVTAFEMLPRRNEFFARRIPVLGDTLVIYIRYDNSYASSLEGTGWVTLLAILLPICVGIDLLFVVFVVLRHYRRQTEKITKEKQKMIQVMLGYVNHEIRNPLHTILGLTEISIDSLSEDDLDTDMLSSNLSTIMRSAEFIEHIANDILDIRRIEEGKITLDVQQLNVRRLLADIEKAAERFVTPEIAFVVECEPGVYFIKTDRYRLEQILMNFISNAFKHTEKGSVVLKFSFSGPEKVRIAVSDTGKGIAEDMKQRLFQQFGQIAASDASDLGGFGLGLFLTRILATLLGGTVGFSSELGFGSIFWVELPVDRDASTLDLQFEETAFKFSK